MPSEVSKEHKKLIARVRKILPDNEVIGYPGPEMNLGHLGNMSGASLRADIFIWWNDNQAVVIEYQSEIHQLEQSNDWHDKDDIAGRDGLKRQLCAHLGLGLVEIWPGSEALTNNLVLLSRIAEAANSSYIDKAAVYEDETRMKSFRIDSMFTSGKITNSVYPLVSTPMTSRPASFTPRRFQ